MSFLTSHLPFTLENIDCLNLVLNIVSFFDEFVADAPIVGEGVLLHHVHPRQAWESSL